MRGVKLTAMIQSCGGMSEENKNVSNALKCLKTKKYKIETFKTFETFETFHLTNCTSLVQVLSPISVYSFIRIKYIPEANGLEFSPLPSHSAV